MVRKRGRTILYILMANGLALNALLYAAYFLEEPDPNRGGYWLLVYFFVIPLLGALGGVALLAGRRGMLRWQSGALVLGYALATWLLTLAAGVFPALGDLLPAGGFEALCAGLLAVTSVGLGVTAWFDYRGQR